MIDIILLLVLASVLTFAMLDIYFYSIIFESFRQYGEKWEQSRGIWRYVRYAINCPFCLAHWVSAAVLIVIVGLGYAGILPLLHPVLALVTIPAVARISLIIRDYSLPPLTNHAFETTSAEEKTDPPSSPSPD